MPLHVHPAERTDLLADGLGAMLDAVDQTTPQPVRDRIRSKSHQGLDARIRRHRWIRSQSRSNSSAGGGLRDSASRGIG